MISFTVTKDDAIKISAIVRRAENFASENGFKVDRMTLNMDLAACHANGTPLKLDALLVADDFNFAHDVFGINHHLDRDDNSPTGGKCLNCFVPRFAAK